ncbi:MAG: WbqC family protein, partial [Propionibacteriaceae bacterium]|nr:WbqC family protein [Propionibacteriaceae bacterium]
MRVAIHQPDLLPYSGYWYKMATSDAFIVSRHDQFQKHGYQRRVKMRQAWCSHVLVGKPSLVPITQVEVAPGWQQHLVNNIRGRYSRAAYYSTRGTELCERILSSSGTMLDEVNLALIEHIREMIGITTPLLFTDPPTGTKGA